jgi:hypothetical protein
MIRKIYVMFYLKILDIQTKPLLLSNITNEKNNIKVTENISYSLNFAEGLYAYGFFIFSIFISIIILPFAFNTNFLKV